MKKLLLVVSLALCSFAANAQIQDVFYKIEGGAAFGRLNSDAVESRTGVGWMGRFYVQLFETDYLGLEAGLGVQQMVSTNDVLGQLQDSRWKVMSIDMPLRSVSRVDFETVSVEPQLGLYFSYGIKASENHSGNLYSSGLDVLRHFNFGIDGTIDVIIADIVKFGVGYQHGWLNMSKVAGKKLRPSIISVTAGVVF